ncbi:hypothetical protein WKW80_22170 [Variovorax humicola]|uniref:ATP-dependent DNA ligase family profile domain-containing protein n=1 Tax=Variovorax humicola TaxID=1769758 RepID=A0ABU8W3S8_9BURK
MKFGGYRLVADLGGAVTLRTRNGANATSWFPEIVSSLSELEGRYVVDGEICTMDDLGRSTFEVLQERARRRRWYEGAPPVVYAVFKLLVNSGVEITQQPLSVRKSALVKLVERGLPGILVVTGFAGGGEGKWLFNGAVQQPKLEGAVAKRLDGVYRPGVCSPDWLKVKRGGVVPAERFITGMTLEPVLHKFQKASISRSVGRCNWCGQPTSAASLSLPGARPRWPLKLLHLWPGQTAPPGHRCLRR